MFLNGSPDAHRSPMSSTTECLDLHLGSPFTANLGDGSGPQPQTAELRESFGDAVLGACIEQLLGGNHLRVYRQNGTGADTGALFLAYVIAEINQTVK